MPFGMSRKAKSAPPAFDHAKHIREAIEDAEASVRGLEAQLGIALIPQVGAHSEAQKFQIERRGGERVHTIYRLVRISRVGDEGLARCRNISDRGARLDTTMDLQPAERIEISFSPTIQIHGVVTWHDQGACGVKFDKIEDCREILKRSAAEGMEKRARPPRLTTNLAATLYYDGLQHEGRVIDVSQRGLKVAQVGGFKPGLRVKVLLSKDRERDALVRWTKDGTSGFYLLDPFSVEELGSVAKL
jgi:hypothetical protein